MADGSQKFSDDFGKWVDINSRLGVVVANNAHQASWMLRKLIPDIKGQGMDWDFTDLEAYLNKNLDKLAAEYYAETGNISNSVGFIFGGFENDKKLVMESGRLGEVMAVPVLAAGEGNTVEQSVDRVIMGAFSEVLEDASQKGKEVPAGTLFEVDLPKPRILAATVRATSSGADVLYENASVYDGLAFNPNYITERVELPAELIGELEYRDKSGEEGQAMLYEDSRIILLYADKLLDEKKWPTVGGEMLIQHIMPNFSGVATGPYIREKNGEVYQGGIGVNDKGQVHFYRKDGTMVPYRFIYDFLEEGKEDSGAKL